MNSEFEAPSIEGPAYSQPPGQVGTSTVGDQQYAFADFKASQAIQGIPRGEVADKMEFLEKEWNDWTVQGATGFPFPKQAAFRQFILKVAGLKGIKLTRQDIIDIAAEPLRIFRLQVRELALAYAAELNNRKAVQIMADIGQAHIEGQKKDQDLRAFLFAHFEEDLRVGTSRNIPLHQIAMDIMLRQFQK